MFEQYCGKCSNVISTVTELQYDDWFVCMELVLVSMAATFGLVTLFMATLFAAFLRMSLVMVVFFVMAMLSVISFVLIIMVAFFMMTLFTYCENMKCER